MEKVKATIGSENYKTVITSPTSEFITDMPIDEGGQNLGPKPKELLAAALAGCVAMTVKMYANRSKWLLEDVFVDVEIDTETTPGTTIFTKNVSFTGSLTDEQIKRLHVIAQKCPINKILQNPISGKIITKTLRFFGAFLFLKIYRKNKLYLHFIAFGNCVRDSSEKPARMRT